MNHGTKPGTMHICSPCAAIPASAPWRPCCCPPSGCAKAECQSSSQCCTAAWGGVDPTFTSPRRQSCCTPAKHAGSAAEQEVGCNSGFLSTRCSPLAASQADYHVKITVAAPAEHLQPGRHEEGGEEPTLTQAGRGAARGALRGSSVCINTQMEGFCGSPLPSLCSLGNMCKSCNLGYLGGKLPSSLSSNHCLGWCADNWSSLAELNTGCPTFSCSSFFLSSAPSTYRKPIFLLTQLLALLRADQWLW